MEIEILNYDNDENTLNFLGFIINHPISNEFSDGKCESYSQFAL